MKTTERYSTLKKKSFRNAYPNVSWEKKLVYFLLEKAQTEESHYHQESIFIRFKYATG